MNQSTRTLFDFTTATEEDIWTSTDDVVMGGVSSSVLRIESQGIAVFEGTISLDQGGGFASVRADLSLTDLEAYDGLEIRIRADGKRYRARLRTASSPASYQSSFETQPGVWQSIRLPFTSFYPTFHGRPVPDAPPLDTVNITSFGWLVADRQAGRFRLEIDWVRAYSADAD